MVMWVFIQMILAVFICGGSIYVYVYMVCYMYIHFAAEWHMVLQKFKNIPNNHQLWFWLFAHKANFQLNKLESQKSFLKFVIILEDMQFEHLINCQCA